MDYAISDEVMTLGSFVVRNAFRNKRRSLLTMISISFSLLLLTLMIWRRRGAWLFGTASRWRFFCRRSIAIKFVLSRA
jgi:hypothetical protein